MRFKPLHCALALLSLTAFTSTPALAANFNVQVSSNMYTPQNIVIGVGDTVTFTNVGGFHNVASNAGAITAFRCANGCDGVGSGNGDASAALWSSTVTFPAPGTIGYFCEIHGGAGVGMFGTITVIVPVALQSFDID